MVIFSTDKVTLYNRHFDPETEEETWFPTLLINSNLVVKKGRNTTKNGNAETDAVKLFVDADSFPNGKRFVDPTTWEKLSIADKANSFTFGAEKDFFVNGDTTSVEITENDFFNYMLKTFDEVFCITEVENFNDVMRHMEIGGK